MYLHLHNPDWIEEYSAEEKLLLSAYTGDIQFHHIGSTAIAGLYAKDCIDILGVVPDISWVKQYVPAIEALGYDYKGSYGIDGREYFSKKKRKVHLHIFQQGHDDIRKHLGFVRLMRESTELADQLNELKLRLHQQFSKDKDAYQREKVFFYDELHKKI